MVEKYSPWLADAEDDRRPWPTMQPSRHGDWVRASDYDALAARLAETERLLEHFRCDDQRVDLYFQRKATDSADAGRELYEAEARKYRPHGVSVSFDSSVPARWEELPEHLREEWRKRASSTVGASHDG
jgi:hypothetical protein